MPPGNIGGPSEIVVGAAARERELQLQLRQANQAIQEKGAELEERGRLLARTKGSIESLQVTKSNNPKSPASQNPFTFPANMLCRFTKN